ncbi:MAG TPA: periplasmic heavy metal sensor [Thermoanaerobaculia bacterium]
MKHNSLQKKLLGGGALLLAGALAAGAALAQSGPGGPGRFARGIRAAMATLDLSDAQKEKVKAIFESHKEEGAALRAQTRTDREALKAAASAAKPDPALVGAAFLKVRADGETARAKMKAVRAEIDAVLTPEQRAKLDGWIAAHRQMRGGLRSGPPQS